MQTTVKLVLTSTNIHCASFEQMRKAPRQNNQKLWEMLEERRQLQASVAHNLRNPIAIIEGHAEYFTLNFPSGKLDTQKVPDIAGNIEKAAKRLENHTDSISTINNLEELEVKCRQVKFCELYLEIMGDLKILAESSCILPEFKNKVKTPSFLRDAQVFYRILENLVSNTPYNNCENHRLSEPVVFFRMFYQHFLIVKPA